ncbi:MAG: SIMPL domain-containing protein, partial [Acidaminococcaceae bacterium]|nr:SIMPL domain-containing protein [Acidaminococcaceae bacterium]
MATLYGNLEKRAAVAETARENLAKDMAAFKHVLLGQAIPGEDIQTVRYSLQPEFSYEKNKRRLTGYVARADYKVKIKNLEKLSAVIDKSVGCNVTVDRVEFGLNNRSLFENRLLEEAVANARSKAAVVARAGGRSLGHLIHASFSTTGNATRAVNRNMVMAKAASMDTAESAPTELDPGVITVNANVDLEFALE